MTSYHSNTEIKNFNTSNKPNHKNQDIIISGTFIKNGETNHWGIICDTHGNDTMKSYIEKMNFQEIIELNNPIEYIITYFKDKYTINSGSTITIIRIYKDRATFQWIGDSNARIYKNDDMIFGTKSHDMYNDEEIKRLSELEKTSGKKIGRKHTWSISILNDTDLTMIKSLYFDFGRNDIINMTNALGHGGLTGEYYSEDTYYFKDPGMYTIVYGSDGFWNMFSSTDISFLKIIHEKSIKDCCDYAFKRWSQEWAYYFDSKFIDKQKIEGNIDDISVGAFRITVK
jgi:serine/threonine protein phosphatase PrpC